MEFNKHGIVFNDGDIGRLDEIFGEASLKLRELALSRAKNDYEGLRRERAFYKEQYDKTAKELAEVKSKFDDYKLKTEASLKEHDSEVIQKYLQDAFFGFTVGQAMYGVVHYDEKVECPTCDGNGRVVIKGNSFRCPRCLGSKTIGGKKVFFVVEVWLASIDCSFSFSKENNLDIKYCARGKWMLSNLDLSFEHELKRIAGDMDEVLEFCNRYSIPVSIGETRMQEAYNSVFDLKVDCPYIDDAIVPLSRTIFKTMEEAQAQADAFNKQVKGG